MAEHKFFGRVADGQVVYDTPLDLRRYLRGMEGERVEVEIRKRRTKRSLAQNAWLWGPAYSTLLAKILKEDGYLRHERTDELKARLHEDLLKLYFGVRTVKRLAGTGTEEIPIRRSSKLTTKEFAAFMEWLVMYAATERGVDLSLPDDDTMPPLDEDDE